MDTLSWSRSLHIVRLVGVGLNEFTAHNVQSSRPHLKIIFSFVFSFFLLFSLHRILIWKERCSESCDFRSPDTILNLELRVVAHLSLNVRLKLIASTIAYHVAANMNKITDYDI